MEIGINLSLTGTIGVPTPWTPNSPAPASWLKADAGLLQAAGGAVASANNDPVGKWLDQSPNARDAIQATAGKKPLLKTAVQNGLPAVLFDGSDDYLLAGPFASPLSLAGATIYLVAANAATPGSVAVPFDVRRNGDGNPILSALYNGSDAPWGRIRNDAGSLVDTGTLSDSGAWAVIEYRWDGATLSVAKDGGSPQTASASGTVTVDGFSLGCNGPATGGAAAVPWNGYVGEFLFYPRALSDGERLLVLAYLRDKWGTS